MRWTRGTWPSLLISCVLVSAVFGQRVFLPLSIGEKQPANFEVLPALLVAVAAIVTALSRGENLRALGSREFLLLWAPYLAMSAVLPLLGVAIGLYPLRGLAAIRVPLIAVSALLIGAEVRRKESNTLAAWGLPLVIAAVLQGAYALFQQLLAGHLLPLGPWDALFRWDISTQLAYGRGLVVGRSAGLYTNANILGTWAGIALLVGIFVMARNRRYLIVGASLAALVLSQSRGATLALVVSLAFLLILEIRRKRAPQLRVLATYGAIVGAVFVGWFLLAAAGAPTSNLPSRLMEGIGILLGGHDPNIAGRVQFWGAGLALLRVHPWGTFGPPEVLLGSAVDSEWVRTLLQGGPLYVIMLGIALVGGALLPGVDSTERRIVRLLSVLLAIAAITQIPMQYPPAVIYWAMIGAALMPWPPRNAQTAGPDPSSPPRMLMVATIARTLETFMPPHVAALRSRGWRVDGAANGISTSSRARAIFNHVWEVEWSRRPLAVANLQALGRIRSVVRGGNYQVVHVQTPVAAFVTRLALRGLGNLRPPIVYTAHGFHFHSGAGWLRNTAYGTLERVAGPWTDELVVVNQDDFEEAVRRRIAPPERLHLIPGVGIDTDHFDERRVSSSEAAEARRVIGVPDEAPMVVTIAEINRNKNLAYLLSALARMHTGVHLVVIGDGPDRDRLEATAANLGLEERVHLVGFVPDVRPWLRAASVFALVSLREGLPGAMMEAMSMGLPVVGTDARGIRDLASGGRGIVVGLNDPDQLAAALERVLADPRAATEMGRLGREFVVAELSIDRVLAAYRVVYEAATVRRTNASIVSG